MPVLHVVVASTRPGRKGPAVADWFHRLALEHGGFDVRLVDLAEVDLPLLDEAAHPRLRQYTHEHTKRWSVLVDSADAFVFVTPEYNFSAPAPLVNALDYLFHEWAYKPVGFVSYGGQSGGIRSVQMAKLIVTALKMMPIPEAVAIPFFTKLFDESGAFQPSDPLVRAGRGMLDELLRWATALAPLRAAAGPAAGPARTAAGTASVPTAAEGNAAAASQPERPPSTPSPPRAGAPH